MKKVFINAILFGALALFSTSCSKDDTTPEDNEDTAVGNSCIDDSNLLSGTWKVDGEDDVCDDGIYEWGKGSFTIDCGDSFDDIFTVEYTISDDCKTYSVQQLFDEDQFNDFTVLELTSSTFKIQKKGDDAIPRGEVGRQPLAGLQRAVPSGAGRGWPRSGAVHAVPGGHGGAGRAAARGVLRFRWGRRRAAQPDGDGRSGRLALP